MKALRQRKAFTIVEMVIVIAVVAVLATVMIPTISGVIDKANVSVDQQFVASLNTQLALWEVDNHKIANEKDLSDAINYYYGEYDDAGNLTEDFYSKLAPKSGKQGYHYWWDAVDATVRLLNDKEMSKFPGVIAEDNVPAFAPGNPRTIANGRFFMMDRTGSQLADLMDSLNRVNNIENDVNNYENVIARFKSVEGDDQLFASLVLSHLSEIAIVNGNGMFVFPAEGETKATVKYIHVPNNADLNTVIVLGSSAGVDANFSAVKRVDIPKGIAVGSNSFSVFASALNGDNELNSNYLKLHFDATLAELTAEDNALIYDDAGRCVIVLSDGSEYIYVDGELCKLPLEKDASGNITTGTGYKPGLSDGVTQFDIFCEEDHSTDGDDDYVPGSDKARIVRLENTDKLYLAYDKKTYTLYADGFNSNAADTTIAWSVPKGCPHTIDNNGVLTLGNLGNIQTDANYEFVVTATAYGGFSKTLPVEIIRITEATYNLFNVNMVATDNTVTLAYKGDTLDFSVVYQSHSAVSYVSCNKIQTFTPIDNDDNTTNVYEWDDTNKKISLIMKQGSLMTGTQKLKVSFGGHVEEVLTIKVVDESGSPFEVVFPNTDKYLYRVGNGNEVSLSSLFKLATGKTLADDAKVEVSIYDVQRSNVDNQTNKYIFNDASRYVHNTELTGADWGSAKVTFSSKDANVTTGVSYIEIKAGNLAPCGLYVEVVDGKNITTSDTSFSGNAVLLSDITLNAKRTITNGTLYGNGFTIDARDYHSGEIGMITLNNGNIDHVRIWGGEFSVRAGSINTDYYNALVYASNGDCTISNSYLYGTRSPARMDAGNLTLQNTTLEGGTYANIFVNKGISLTLDNVTTIQEMNRHNLLGAGVIVAAADSTSVIIKNELKQYNWVSQSDLEYFPDAVSTLANTLFTSTYSAYQFEVNGKTCVNVGLAYMVKPADGKWDETGLTSDLTYALLQPTSLVDAHIRVFKNNTDDAKALVNVPADLATNYSGADVQGATVPKFVFDKVNNYVQDAGNKTEYYYYDTEKPAVVIGVVEGTPVKFNLNRVSLGKYGIDLTDIVNVSVGSGGTFTDVTTGYYEFENEGTYTIRYWYSDEYQYDQNGKKVGLVDYKHDITVEVNVIIPDAKTAEFTFSNGSSNYAGVSTLDRTGGGKYVMPTGSGVGTYTTPTGQTVNFAKVNGVQALEGDGTTNYKYYYIFAGVNIVDDGTTYNSATKDMPTNLTWVETVITKGESKDIQAGSEISNRAKGAAFVTGKGLAYKTDGQNVSKSSSTAKARAACSVLLGFKYVDKSGTNWYYYVEYSFGKQDLVGGCVTPDTLVTLADGTQKEIQYVTYEDKLKVWNFYEGKYDIVPASIIFNMGTDYYDVLTLIFEDGTTVKTINGHRFFDMTANRFELVNTSNVGSYIGHEFAKADGDSYKTVKLVDYSITEEYTTSYSIMSAYHYNFFVEGMFSDTFHKEDAPLFDFFEVGDDMVYDAAKMQADIEKYGLYSYEDFEDYLTYEQFVALNVQYMKITVEKGQFTYEGILNLINMYLKG